MSEKQEGNENIFITQMRNKRAIIKQYRFFQERDAANAASLRVAYIINMFFFPLFMLAKVIRKYELRNKNPFNFITKMRNGMAYIINTFFPLLWLQIYEYSI